MIIKSLPLGIPFLKKFETLSVVQYSYDSYWTIDINGQMRTNTIHYNNLEGENFAEFSRFQETFLSKIFLPESRICGS